MSIRQAAKKVGVPFENLHGRAKGEARVTCRRDPMLVYLCTGAEQGLIQVVEHRSVRGFCTGYAELRFLIRQTAIVSSLRSLMDTSPDHSPV
ncbi:hypothetical protein PC129_g14984 [Phytophthora cactorum]|nr:hypothetical protein Pcac1_g24733 [Phytophthora cactorum]KAG2907086.1 hypothetical protein PC114_g10939 [Phytophthora cactorum]KAG2938502.1 hypothetical protein PC117_g11202 [Phytophthora cactorum]KAG2984148.1 hypothetical protein PC118_g9040 [Phytophthora cactorum]KAG3016814.1 hypothetical protein PC119_g11232 [Phytophthora cactorum]